MEQSATTLRRIQTLIDKAAEVCDGQSELARRIGYNPQQLSQWKSGKVPCPAKAQILLAHEANMDANEVAAYALVDSEPDPVRKERLAIALGKQLVRVGAAASLLMYAATGQAWTDLIRCILC
jgi:DNA-binding transcriptional regulator YdaS (Cro superfamily)